MELSIDILSIIFGHLDTKSLIWSSRTCKKWRRVFIKYLPKYKLYLSPYRNKITDAGLEHLKGVHTIDFLFKNNRCRVRIFERCSYYYSNCIK